MDVQAFNRNTAPMFCRDILARFLGMFFVSVDRSHVASPSGECCFALYNFVIMSNVLFSCLRVASLQCDCELIWAIRLSAATRTFVAQYCIPVFRIFYYAELLFIFFDMKTKFCKGS
jgi:hypothetical protein